MHYYKRNLGDYAKKAGRLSMLQHGSYTLLIDACYDREQFPTLDEAIEWTWASSAAEIEAVEFVLRKFFTLEDGVYVQKRIQEEIAEYRLKAETNKRIATERETNRKQKNTNRSPVVNEPPPNHKPLTINQEPVVTPLPPDGGETVDAKFEAFWMAYPKKVGKGATRKAWDRVKQPAASLDLILKALSWQVASEQWTKNGGQFIPNPATYLNQQRWLDERPSAVVKSLTAVGQKSADSASRWLESEGFQLEKTA